MIFKLLDRQGNTILDGKKDAIYQILNSIFYFITYDLQ